MRKNDTKVGKNNPHSMVATDRNGCTKSVNAYYTEHGPRFAPLDREDEKKLLIRVQNGDKKAERELFLAHARFVISVAKKMHGERKTHSRVASLNDFIQWGNMGMIRAMYRCDVSYENRFLSYAVHWIEQFMQNGYEKHAHTIFVPSGQKKALRELRKHEDTADGLIEIYSGNDDVDYYVASDFLSKHARAALLIPHQYHALNDCVSVFISVDDAMPVETSTESILYSDDETDERLMKESFVFDLECALGTLTEREKYIVALSFGITSLYEEIFNSVFSNNAKKREYYMKCCSIELGLEEIGEMFNVSRERARQIKDKALQRLRHTRRSKLLKQYLG